MLENRNFRFYLACLGFSEATMATTTDKPKAEEPEDPIDTVDSDSESSESEFFEDDKYGHLEDAYFSSAHSKTNRSKNTTGIYSSKHIRSRVCTHTGPK